MARKNFAKEGRTREAAPLPIVFLGPSLAHADARAILNADYRPPIRS
jgi:hypothetical protein